MKSQWEKWVDVARLASEDPHAQIECPVCAASTLTVTDVAPFPDSGVFERYLECPSCGARNIMRMRRKPADSTGGTPT